LGLEDPAWGAVAAAALVLSGLGVATGALAGCGFALVASAGVGFSSDFVCPPGASDSLAADFLRRVRVRFFFGSLSLVFSVSSLGVAASACFGVLSADFSAGAWPIAASPAGVSMMNLGRLG